MTPVNFGDFQLLIAQVIREKIYFGLKLIQGKDLCLPLVLFCKAGRADCIKKLGRTNGFL